MTALVAVIVATVAIKVDDWLAPPLLPQAVVWGVVTPLAVIVALRMWLAWRIAKAYRRQHTSGE